MASEVRHQAVEEQLLDGQYVLGDVIGRGRQSIVYRAEHLTPPTPHQKFVALKLIFGSNKDAPAVLRRVRREALGMLATRSDHTIRLFDYVTDREQPYLVMEYAERGDLKAYVTRQGGSLVVDEALELMVQTLRGLSAVHRAGMLHRDIKAENLLLTGQRTIKLADFSIASVPNEYLTLEKANPVVGTFDYLAPESLNDGVSSVKSDLYSVAMTFYELITGVYPFGDGPFSEQVARKLSGEWTPLEEYIHPVPKHLSDLFRIGLASTPDERFQSADEFRMALEGIRTGSWAPPVRVPEEIRLPVQEDLLLKNEFASEEYSAEERESVRFSRLKAALIVSAAGLFAGAAVFLLPKLIPQGQEKVSMLTEAFLGPEPDVAKEDEAEKAPSEEHANLMEFLSNKKPVEAPNSQAKQNAAAPQAIAVNKMADNAPPPVAVEPPAAVAPPAPVSENLKPVEQPQLIAKAPEAPLVDGPPAPQVPSKLPSTVQGAFAFTPTYSVRLAQNPGGTATALIALPADAEILAKKLKLHIQGESWTLPIVPLPAKGQYFATFPTPEKEFSLTLIGDAAGKQILSEPLPIQIDCRSLPASGDSGDQFAANRTLLGHAVGLASKVDFLSHVVEVGKLPRQQRKAVAPQSIPSLGREPGSHRFSCLLSNPSAKLLALSSDKLQQLMEIRSNKIEILEKELGALLSEKSLNELNARAAKSGISGKSKTFSKDMPRTDLIFRLALLGLAEEAGTR